MRIIIEIKERHRNLFIEMAKAVKAKVTIEEEEKTAHLPKKSSWITLNVLSAKPNFIRREKYSYPL